MTQKTESPAITEPTSQKLEREPIAIVGIGCRFPGGVVDPETFWRLLYDEVDAITEIPSNRIDLEKFYDPRPATPGKIMTQWGGFLSDIDRFDASFFGIAPREADRIDPQQRLLLEVAWEALEDAGKAAEYLMGSDTGVFVGMWLNDYETRMFADTDATDFYMTTGSGRYSASGRVSYNFGFQGPSVTIDTACSSSLVAVHLACQSLRSGESSLALAGGANVILQPHISIAYSQSRMLAPDGRCKFGDARANGYVRSEGAALIVLKPLAQAMSDGDRIYAVIRGSAVNNDGRSSGFLATPGREGQEEMLRRAYEDANIAPNQVQYVEAHGTGTRAGDPVELGAIGAVVGANRSAETLCSVGSVKSNFGHTEGAAGVAGLIKVALSLQHRVIPANLHVQELNPNIPWEQLNLTVPTVSTPWPAVNGEAVGGVSSFGIAGTNAHIVLAEAPMKRSEASEVTLEKSYVLSLSAHTPEALRVLAENYKSFLAAEKAPTLANICYTASCRRTHHLERLALVGDSHQALIDQLNTYLEDELYLSSSEGSTSVDNESKIVFVFPGQGSQWVGMGRQLLEQSPIFYDTLKRCEQVFQPWVDWSLLEQLTLDEDSPVYRLNEISVIQPTLFAIEVALAAVWQSWGINPDAVIGHSMGEVAAAYVAGALNLEDAAQVICSRSQLMQQTSGQGAMAVVGLPFEQAEEVLQGYENQLSIAVHNSPRSTVLSGDPDALNEVMDKLRAREVFCRLVKVDVASHSPQMDSVRAELVASLANIQAQTPVIPIYSTATETIIEGPTLDAEYWGKNLRQPVRFLTMSQQLLADEFTVFIELSPHPVLLAAIEENAAELQKPNYNLASLKRDQPELATLLNELGSLYKRGYAVEWNKLYPTGGQVVSLPTYPWQRELFWIEASALSSRQRSRPGAHPLLSHYLRSAAGDHIWETTLSPKLFPYLKDHQVRGSVVFPAAAYIEMALAAISELYGSGSHLIKKVSFKEALFLDDDKPQLLQLTFTADMPDTFTFRIYSHAEESDAQETWTLHVEGKLQPNQEVLPSDTLVLSNSQPDTETSAEEFYSVVAARRLEYGPNFQAITRLFRDNNRISGDFRLPEELTAGLGAYILHPVLIDACFQLLLAALPESNLDTYLPVTLDKLQVYERSNLTGQLRGVIVPEPDADMPTADVFLLDEADQIVMAAHKLRFQHLEQASEEVLSDWMYKTQWQPSPLPQSNGRGPAESGHWLIFADNKGVGQALAKQLESSGHSCILISSGADYQAVKPNVYRLDPTQPDQFHHLMAEVLSSIQTSATQSIQGIVHLWSLDNGGSESITSTSLEMAQQLGSLSVLHLIQALAQTELSGSPRLWLVTRGAQVVASDAAPAAIAQSPLWGMGRVIANEFPDLHCTCLDLSLAPTSDEIKLMAQTLQSSDAEDQIAFRANQRYAARLKHYDLPADDNSKPVAQQNIPADQPFRVEVTTPGVLDNLLLRPILRQAPQPGQVEIEVKATALNFMNIMSALGIYPGYANGVGPLGIECAGVISAVGTDVSGLHIGDEVAAIAFDSLGTYAVADAHLVVSKPSALSFEEAAALPIVYLTAYYTLYYLGRLQPGERVLIHSAAGGVGLAAIQLAQRIGAEIFATAGSPEKRAYLQAMGIQHVMDSRSLGFAEQIMEQTNGEGVDLVLNSLAGSAITKGFESLKPYGRFLEIGKRDIYDNSKLDLLPFRNNLSYFAVDLDKMSRERPDIVGKMLREVFQLIETGEITSLPLKVFPVSKVSDAFRYMAQAKHTGKIVVSIQDAEAKLDVAPGTIPIRSDGTYLITGGLGSLGLTIAEWLAQQGARNLVLIGRSQPSKMAQATINNLEAVGVNIVVAQADVTDLAQMSALFTQIEETLPVLRGVIHAAGLLADSTLLQMDQNRFSKAMAPKVLGGWNLHTLIADKPVDFFVLFSSVAALLGLPGQANYAAANAFLDALAHYRWARNLPALSINWGPWRDTGLAAAQANRGERLMLQGLKGIGTKQGLEAMSYVLAQKEPQIGVMSFEPSRWSTSYPAAVNSSLLANLLNQATDEIQEPELMKYDVREALLTTELGRQRQSLFETHIREQVAQVLRLPPSRVPLDKPLKSLGLDSLMSLELRNRLETSFGLTLSATLIWNYPTITVLVPFLAEKMQIPLATESTTTKVTGDTSTLDEIETIETLMDESNPNNIEVELENLSKKEVENLLADELATIDDLLNF
ncbi:MAG: type I polyketide synthase [Anaerolineae bacterium]|nr:type I polyketide synthase [Anaerolineae bacterium]